MSSNGSGSGRKLMRSARILGTGSCLPERGLTNAELEQMVDTTDEWIRERTGIRERRIADEGTASSDLGTVAGQRALDAAGIKASELDAIIVATITPDRLFPSTACYIQASLGAGEIPAFDVSAACSGFVYGLEIARGLIATGDARRILLVGSECLSKITDWNDRSTCVLLGDGAGAVVIGDTDPGQGILSIAVGADGNAEHLLKLPAGGSRIPATHESIDQGLHTIQMQGAELYKVAVRMLVDCAEKALAGCGMGVDDVDLFIPHQANARIIEAVVKRLSLPMNKVFMNLEFYGNTSAASVAIALDEAVRKGRVHDDDIIVLDVFGGGATWACAVLRW